MAKVSSVSVVKPLNGLPNRVLPNYWGPEQRARLAADVPEKPFGCGFTDEIVFRIIKSDYKKIIKTA